MFISGPEGPFWDEPCPERGPGLSHTQDVVKAGRLDMCVDCRLTNIRKRPELTPPTPVVRSVTADHQYRFTITGRCATCSRVEDDHPLIGIPDPQTGCDVDHKSIRSDALLIGDEGQVRVACPRCGVMVEPKVAAGSWQGHVYVPAVLPGRPDDRGRGYFTQRHRDELERLRRPYKDGWFQR